MVAKAYLSDFTTDIFISYNHIDNHPIDSRGTLWVDNFHRELQGLINTCVGHPVSVWRDPRLSRNSVFSEEITQHLRETAILLAIVSPGYLQSEWCTREREIFVDASNRNGGLDIANTRRIISAIKLPITHEELPEVLKPALGFELYTFDEQTGKANDYLFDPRPEAERLYRRTLSHLAQTIADMLKLIARGGPSRASNGREAVVYLAETTSDLERERNAFRLELEARGCAVVPRQPLPHRIDECLESARADLARTKVSFHFLGKRYGLVPEGGDRSLIEIQTELAGERTIPGLKSVFWIPRGLASLEPQQTAFLERIRTLSNAAAGFELLECSFEDLKTFAIDLIERKISSPTKDKIEAARVDSSNVPQVYLVRDKEDREQVAPLTKYLFEQGIEVLTPPDEGEEVQLRQNHQENLKSCDGVMIWWGSTKKIWLDYMMRDLDRARGLGRTGPFRTRAVCIAGPPAPDKDDFMTHKAQVIRFSGGFPPDALSPLVQALKVTYA